jgi:hypothetical protein
MHFRFRGSGIQILRSTYDPATKRSSTKAVGVVPTATLAVKHAILEELTPAERQELDDFLTTYRNTQVLKRRLAAHQLPETIANVIEYYKSVTDQAEKDRLHSYIVQSIIELRRGSSDAN